MIFRPHGSHIAILRLFAIDHQLPSIDLPLFHPWATLPHIRSSITEQYVWMYLITIIYFTMLLAINCQLLSIDLPLFQPWATLSAIRLGNVTGYPRAFQGNPCPYLSKPVPVHKGMGFDRYGSWCYVTDRKDSSKITCMYSKGLNLSVCCALVTPSVQFQEGEIRGSSEKGWNNKD